MTDDEKKEIIEVLQSRTSWHYMDVQKMLIFGVLAFLAQFVFNQFAGDGQKMSDMLVAQEAMKQEIKSMTREIAAIREGTEKRYRSDDAEKDIGILQRQIDALMADIKDDRIWIGNAKTKIRDLEMQLTRLVSQIENGSSSSIYPTKNGP